MTIMHRADKDTQVHPQSRTTHTHAKRQLHARKTCDGLCVHCLALAVAAPLHNGKRGMLARSSMLWVTKALRKGFGMNIHATLASALCMPATWAATGIVCTLGALTTTWHSNPNPLRCTRPRVHSRSEVGEDEWHPRVGHTESLEAQGSIR